MNRYVTVGLAAVAGAALFEAALIPGMVIGAAAVLAPKVLPSLRRRLGSLIESPAQPRIDPGYRPPLPDEKSAPVSDRPVLRIGRSLAKTITFRIIVTTLDFTSNYVVIGELATAAGLSAIALVAGPLFYFVHEAAWNYFGPSSGDVPLPLPLRPDVDTPTADAKGIALSRPVAKTITFRTFATVMDFTATYVVVGDTATAVGLTAFGFVVGPFVYYGHEKAWDYFDSSSDQVIDPPNSLTGCPELVPTAG